MRTKSAKILNIEKLDLPNSIGKRVVMQLEISASTSVTLIPTKVEGNKVTGNVVMVGVHKNSEWTEVFFWCIGNDPFGIVENGVFTIYVED